MEREIARFARQAQQKKEKEAQKKAAEEKAKAQRASRLQRMKAEQERLAAQAQKAAEQAARREEQRKKEEEERPMRERLEAEEAVKKGAVKKARLTAEKEFQSVMMDKKLSREDRNYRIEEIKRIQKEEETRMIAEGLAPLKAKWEEEERLKAEVVARQLEQRFQRNVSSGSGDKGDGAQSVASNGSGKSGNSKSSLKSGTSTSALAEAVAKAKEKKLRLQREREERLVREREEKERAEREEEKRRLQEVKDKVNAQKLRREREEREKAEADDSKSVEDSVVEQEGGGEGGGEPAKVELPVPVSEATQEETDEEEVVPDEELATPRELSSDETAELRELLKGQLTIQTDDDGEDAENVLDYAIEMINNGESVGHVTEELPLLEMPVCDEFTAQKVGAAMAKFYIDLRLKEQSTVVDSGEC